ncbi:MAG: RNA methyltransferase [Calditrichia bacterium]
MPWSWKQYQKLRLKKYREEWRLFAVEGTRLCREALASGWKIEAVFLNESFLQHLDSSEFEKILHRSNLKHEVLGDTNFRKLADTEHPQGVLFIVRMPETSLPPAPSVGKINFVLILDGIRDPGNMGTILRSADWFGVEVIYASTDSVDFYNPKVIRASMGSFFHVPFIETDSLPQIIRELKKSDFHIIGTSLQSKRSMENLSHRDPPFALILGGEAQGMSPALMALADSMVKIDKFGKAESLNVAVAGGVLMNFLAQNFYKKMKKSK